MFGQKQKKWWQFAPSERLSNKEQVEIFALVLLMIIFILAVYHIFVIRPIIWRERDETLKREAEIINVQTPLLMKIEKLKSH